MTWRLAKSLEKLRSQVNEALPKRDKSGDGTIGDEGHASRSSDHNPWLPGGIVSALDLTHDPKNGFNSYLFADYLQKTKDPRIKYVISNGRIFAFNVSPWKWRKYTGLSPHDHHVHVSVRTEPEFYDDAKPWNLEGFSFAAAKNALAASTPDYPVISKGVRGAAVEELQRILKLEVDGHFGPRTDEAVRDFQKISGLFADGVVGAYTWEKLRKVK